ncbi:YqgE/AlgH family protein [Bauldia sp.]|uniref:YqgE/AlgH family protein n=1 Tax=Bauldia sp. TaxID=2575872 RepID=UPI0025BC7BE4|nr:YqgE/AlgH family protein [Bauldia sp.]
MLRSFAMAKAQKAKTTASQSYLDGQLLIAMPGMQDSRFARTVVFLCAHSADGAMGIMVNQPARDITFRDLLVQLDIIPEGSEIRLPEAADNMQVYRGGPVETGRGFVLHSTDYFIKTSTLPIDDHVNLTATLEILKAIAHGNGPRSAMLALGYAGWAPGQLESEIQANGWLTCPATPELIFDTDIDAKYDRALAQLGIDSSRLSGEAGHA